MRQDLVLLPGLACDARLYAAQTASLADLAAPLVPNLDAASMAEMAEAVLDAAPKRFALAGLSMGGYVAMEIVRRAPSRVTRLALISTTARPDAPEQTAMRRELIELARGDRFGLVMPRLLPKLISAHRRDDAALKRLVIEMADAVGAEAFARQQTAILSRPDSRAASAASSRVWGVSPSRWRARRTSMRAASAVPAASATRARVTAASPSARRRVSRAVRRRPGMPRTCRSTAKPPCSSR